jgi:hypothetical protein
MMSILLEMRVADGKPILRGHDHYWSVIRDLGKEHDFTLAEVAQHSNDPKDKSIGDFLGRLVKAGFVEVVRTEFGPTQRGGLVARQVYKLVKRPMMTPIVKRDGSKGSQGVANTQMWNAIRSLKQFDKRELSLAATTEDVEVAINTALAYARHLAKAGYLMVMRQGKSKTTTIWRLRPQMNTGPEAPRILRSKTVYDVNRNEVMG